MYNRIQTGALTWEDRRDIAHRLHVRRERARIARKAWEWVKVGAGIIVVLPVMWFISIVILSI
jgi:hypothetical protein